jgi:hypothetical protein
MESRRGWALDELGSLRSGRGGNLWLRGEEHDKRGVTWSLPEKLRKKKTVGGWFWNQQQASPTRASETVYRPRLAHS